MFVPTTYLFVPGDRPDRFEKALTSGADRVILDLEDAVRPEAKATARDSILGAKLDWARVVVRINDATSPFFAEDLRFVADLKASAVMVPKTETPDALTRVSTAAGREMELLPQIETVLGLETVPALLNHPNARRAVFGHLDFALDLGAAPDWEALLYARSRLVALSRLADALPPIESVTVDVKDMANLKSETAAAQRLGFGGKLLIHPAQVAPVTEVFRPSGTEIAWARRVMSAVSTASEGAVAVDGKMIDKPVEEAARRILARAGEPHA